MTQEHCQIRTGVYPGTFDPITTGHMDIIKRALKVVDKLVIAVAEDSGKSPIFSLQKRSELVQADVRDALAAADQARVKVETFHGLLVNFAKEQEASVLIRGLRAVSDYEYEFQMACMNNKLAPDIETVFLTASESTHFISSRFVKQIAKLGGNISELVSANTARELKEKFEHGDPITPAAAL